MSKYNFMVFLFNFVLYAMVFGSEEKQKTWELLTKLKPNEALVSFYKQKISDTIPVIAIRTVSTLFASTPTYLDYTVKLESANNTLLYTEGLRSYINNKITEPYGISTMQVNVLPEDFKQITDYIININKTEPMSSLIYEDVVVQKNFAHVSNIQDIADLYKLLCLYAPRSMFENLIQPSSETGEQKLKKERLAKVRPVIRESTWPFQNITSPLKQYWQKFISLFEGRHTYYWGVAGLTGLGTAYYLYKNPYTLQHALHMLRQHH